jgi:hypothetical protein
VIRATPAKGVASSFGAVLHWPHTTLVVNMRARTLATILIVWLVAAPFAAATDYTSTNFISRDPVFGDYGAYKSGDTFQQFDVGGQAVIGESQSSNFILRSGFMYFNEYTPRTENWRWYGDETNETPTSALAAENTAPSSVTNADPVKLRITVRELAGISSESVKFRLQYSTAADFTTSSFVQESSCAASASWCYADGGGADNAFITTKVLTTSDSCTGSVGTGCGTHNESGTSSSTTDSRFSSAMEYEFTIKPAGPLPNTVYYFRIVTLSGTPLVPFTDKTYPSLTTQGASLLFTVNGVSSGTVTEGVTTDVTTTGSSIPFGTLAPGVPVEAAQSLHVETNAPWGYTVYVNGSPSLIASTGATIDGVLGTNASPAAWGIPPSEDAAYGYHSADGLLSAGSTRFAADDTYAAMENGAREIVYTGNPVVSEDTNIIYKAEVEALQPPGRYAGRLWYIILPVF